jgi:CheY-like chemotaxis protein
MNARTNVILVDDDVFTRDMFASILQDNGYTVKTASNGKEMFEKYGADLNDLNIDMVVSDVNMPVMDGIQLVKELRMNNLDLPVILITTRRHILKVMDALNNGADDYVLKDERIQETFIRTINKIRDESRTTG